MHLKNLFRLLKGNKLLAIILILISCYPGQKGIRSFKAVPFSTGQWVEYIDDSQPYENFHVRFAVLDINDIGISLETNYFHINETLKIVSFHNFSKNFAVDTFLVQYNSDMAYKFISGQGNFLFNSPIPNLFIWQQYIDSLNWHTMNINNKQYNVFPVYINADTILFSPIVPIFNIAVMKISGKNLIIDNFGNKGGRTLINRRAETLLVENLPDEFRRIIEP